MTTCACVAALERYLTEQGFRVRSVANAEQMDRLLTRESFHLMVLDLMLPGEDGLYLPSSAQPE
ncbi:response regulator [Klebsiella pneumoniae]|uniref:Response regulator n=1 Tax=Klebsiella pneumoniae TaxID=573 RepID=A0A939SS77_KLEPN|nr:response regulator [Klebsiella pneumoniae]